MDKFIEERYLDEIIRQSQRALYCYELMKEYLQQNKTEVKTEEVFREIEHFVQHISAISRFLWGHQKGKYKEVSNQLKNRLNIDDNNSLSNRSLRNHLVHFDERLIDWAESSQRHNMIDQCIGDVHRQISGIDSSDYIRNYNPNNDIYSFIGESYNLSTMVDEVKKIKVAAEQRKMVLSSIASS